MATGGGTGGGGGSAGAIMAGRAFVRLYTDNTQLEAGLKAARRKVAAFGSLMQKAGAVTLSAGGGLLSAVGLKAIGSLDQTANLSATAAAFGLSAEAASRLFGVMASSGSDLRDATEGLVTFGQRVDEAMAGKGEVAAELFQKLGVGAEAFFGLNPAEQFDKVMLAIRRVEKPADRVNLLMKAFGEDTGKNLLKLLAKTPAELDRLGKSFELSADDMAKADAASAAYAGAMAGLGGVWQQVSVSLAPAITDLADTTTRAAAAASEFIKANRAVIVGAAAVAVGVTAAGAAMLGIGVTASVAATALGGIATAVGAILTPAGLVTAAVAGLGYALATGTEDGRAVMAAFGQTFTDLRDTATASFTGISDALSAGDLTQAGKVAMAGLKVAWQTVTVEMTAIWGGFNDAILNRFRETSDELAKVMVRMLATQAKATGPKFWDGVGQGMGLGAGPAWLQRLNDPLGLKSNAIGMMKDLAEGDTDQILQTLTEDNAARQTQRDGASVTALTAAQDALKAAREEWKRLAAESASKAANAAGIAAGLAAAAATLPTAEKKLMDQVNASTKSLGRFLGGANAQQVFGQGTSDVAKKQLTVQEDLRDAVKVLPTAKDIGKEIAKYMPMFG